MQSLTTSQLNTLNTILSGEWTLNYTARVYTSTSAYTTYTASDIREVSVKQSLMPSLSLGNAVSAQLDITVKQKSITVPRNGKIVLLANVYQSSVQNPLSVTNIPFGTYFIDTRAEVYNGYWHFTAFDAMSKADIPAKNLFSNELEFPKTERVVASAILTHIGVTYTSTDFSTSTMVEYPNDRTAREVLSAICASHGCSGYLTPNNAFRMVSPKGNNGTATIGKKCQSFQVGKTYPAVTGVRLFWNDGNAFLGGSASGYVIESECYYATQALATAAYNANSSFTYKPYRAEKAKLNPIAELGDIVVIDSQSYKLDNIEWSSDGHATIYSPSGDTTEHEFEYVGEVQRELDKRVVLGADYLGNSITREHGFVSELVSNGTIVARATLNANEFLMQRLNNGTWVDDIYFDTVSGKYKITGDVEIEAQSNITLRTVNAVWDGTITLYNVSGAQYGFSMTTGGYYESRNAGVNDSAALAMLKFTATSNCMAYLDVISDGERSYDYGLISTVYHSQSEQPFSTTYTADTQNVLKSFYGIGSANWVTVAIPLTVGDNYVTVKYRKDYTQHSYQDVMRVRKSLTPPLSSTIQLLSDGVVISSANIEFTGAVTFADLSTSGKTTINGDNITTGTITVGAIPSTIARTSQIPIKTSDLTNDSEFQTASGVTTIVGDTIRTGNITAEHLSVYAANVIGSISLRGLMTVYTGATGTDVGGYIGYTQSNVDETYGIAMRSSMGYHGEVVATNNGARISYGTTSQVYATATLAGMESSYVKIKASDYTQIESSTNAITFASDGCIIPGTALNPSDWTNQQLGYSNRYWGASYIRTGYFEHIYNVTKGEYVF